MLHSLKTSQFPKFAKFIAHCIVRSTKASNKLEEAIKDFNKAIEKHNSTRAEAQKSLLSGDQLTVDQVLTFGRSVADGWKPGKEDKYLAKINKFLKSLQAYGPIVEVFIRPVPAVKSIIWGGIKLVLAVRHLDRSSLHKSHHADACCRPEQYFLIA